MSKIDTAALLRRLGILSMVAVFAACTVISTGCKGETSEDGAEARNR